MFATLAEPFFYVFVFLMRMITHFSKLPDLSGFRICSNCNMTSCIAVNSYVMPGTLRFFIREDNCYISVNAVDFYLGDFLEVARKMIVKQKFKAGDKKDFLFPIDLTALEGIISFTFFYGF
ncbi:hypothetical protein [Methanosarcina horonobensis]|uniref:hypothetical protein n=1 Tax=Methanosarcina horonobensis TaxID=418008 RepID=UPI0022B90E6F|nr:hypothetical protein [Methanosarcina horonobensis]